MSPFVVTQECLDLGLRARALVLRGLQIEDASTELREAIDREAARIRQRFEQVAEIRSLPEIVRVHEIIRAVGAKPKSRPPSTQKLLEYAWKRGTLPAVNVLVDAYNWMSLRTTCSLGAHDLGRIATPVELRLFRGTETFRPLGSDEMQSITKGEFGYVDAQVRVVCRLDSLQADFSKVTASTTDVLLIIESTTAHTSEQLAAIVADTAAAITQYCPGTIEVVAPA
jgi:DNA/RNA-binding domain of Phe-tRNA-synthetase-like protein